MKLVTLTAMIRVAQTIPTACPPGYLWDSRHENVGIDRRSEYEAKHFAMNLQRLSAMNRERRRFLKRLTVVLLNIRADAPTFRAEKCSPLALMASGEQRNDFAR
jgi:hypothetical protein